MNKVRVNNIEIVYTTTSNNSKKLSIQSKRALVEYALTLDNTNKTKGHITDRMKFYKVLGDALDITTETARDNMYNWIALYNKGLLDIDNTFSVSHKPKVKVKITLSEVINNKANEITILKQQLDKLSNELSVLRQAQSLVEGVEL